MSKLKEGWERVKLKEIVEIIMGQSPKSEFYNTEGKGLPFFQGCSEFGELYPETEKWCTKFLKIAQKEDVLMSVRAPVGDLNIAKEKCIIGRGLCAIRTKLNNERFPYYLLKGNIERLISLGSGSVYKSVTKSTIEDFEVNVPPLPVQREIASVLSAYDDLIENNNRRIQILEEMAQTVYKEWFVKFRFPGHEDVKMVDSELDEIPEGWEVAKLSEIVETQYGYTESASEEQIGPKFLRGTDINKASYIIWDNVPFCQIDQEDLEKYRLKRNDIVVIRMADPGKVGIVEKDIEAVFASYLIRLKPTSDKITPYYLFYFLQSDRYQNYITGASTGTTRKSASAGVITDIDICISPMDLLLVFENKITLLRKQLNVLLDKNSILRRTRDLLLPRLISGEIDVSDLDIEVDSEKMG